MRAFKRMSQKKKRKKKKEGEEKKKKRKKRIFVRAKNGSVHMRA